MADLLTDLRDHLVAANVVRRPREASPAGRPPLWLEPRDGVPAPGEGQNATEIGPTAVVGAFLSGGIPARPYESSLREDTVDFWIRTTTAPVAVAVQDQLRDALIDRRQTNWGSRTVIDCEEWRAMQRFSSDQTGFTWIWAIWVQNYA